jgi:RNA polymerase sigma-70 factor (ECF subfamily)
MCLQHPRDINEAIDHHHEFLVRFLYYRTGNWQTAEDLAQDVWLRIWQGLYTYDPSGGFVYRTWLCWLARQRAYVHNRANSVHPRISLDEEASDPVDTSTPDPLLAAVRRETQESVQQAIWKLPDLFREVVSLYYMEGMTCDEIARIQDCPAGTVHSRLHAARLLLRDSLDEPALVTPTAFAK